MYLKTKGSAPKIVEGKVKFDDRIDVDVKLPGKKEQTLQLEKLDIERSDENDVSKQVVNSRILTITFKFCL